MFIIGATKKLQKELNRQIETFDEKKENNINLWIGNLFKISRYKCVIMMNCETRYCVVLFRMRKKEFENIEALFQQQLRRNLKYDGISNEKINGYLKESKYLYTNTFSRSILGSIKEMVYYSEILFSEIGIDNPNMDYINKNLNNTIHLPLGPHTPNELMKSKLEEMYT